MSLVVCISVPSQSVPTIIHGDDCMQMEQIVERSRCSAFDAQNIRKNLGKLMKLPYMEADYYSPGFVQSTLTDGSSPCSQAEINHSQYLPFKSHQLEMAGIEPGTFCKQNNYPTSPLSAYRQGLAKDDTFLSDLLVFNGTCVYPVYGIVVGYSVVPKQQELIHKSRPVIFTASQA